LNNELDTVSKFLDQCPADQVEQFLKMTPQERNMILYGGNHAENHAAYMVGYHRAKMVSHLIERLVMLLEIRCQPVGQQNTKKNIAVSL